MRLWAFYNLWSFISSPVLKILLTSSALSQPMIAKRITALPFDAEQWKTETVCSIVL